MEIAHIEDWQHARGTQIGSTYELRWELDGERLRAEVVGVESREFELGDADFFDLHDSAFFNSLPVVRDGLLRGGPPRDYAMRFVTHHPLSAARSQQRYTPLGEMTIRFSSDDFEADIEFDADGFVTLYHGYIERLS
jgi:uncharacterized protein